jgi:hypothetical protein
MSTQAEVDLMESGHYYCSMLGDGGVTVCRHIVTVHEGRILDGLDLFPEPINYAFYGPVPWMSEVEAMREVLEPIRPRV